MSEWTETARRALDEYCARSRAALAGTGADANEVIEDIRLIRSQLDRCRSILNRMAGQAGHAFGESIQPVSLVMP